MQLLCDCSLHIFFCLIFKTFNNEFRKHLREFKKFDREGQENAILALIDQKVESEMEKVLSEIRSVNDKIMTTRYLIIGLGFLMTIISIVLPIILKFQG